MHIHELAMCAWDFFHCLPTSTLRPLWAEVQLQLFWAKSWQLRSVEKRDSLKQVAFIATLFGVALLR
jgi:hypothetical protein